MVGARSALVGVAVSLAAAVLAACGGGAMGPNVTPSATSAPLATSPRPTATARPATALATSTAPSTSATAETVIPSSTPPPIRPTQLPPIASATPRQTVGLAPAEPTVQVWAAGLDTPWAIDFAPDGRVFITERPGRIRVVKDGRLQPEPWMTLDVIENGESGLFGLAVDPRFQEDHFIYAAYTYKAGDGRTYNRLARLRDDPATGKGSLDKVLIDRAPAGNIHDGGRVKFGPDGKLYWTVGDAGGNPSTAQDRASLGGKVLRLNPDGSIPADNPFPNSYVYSYGNRNAQGLAWQPGTGRLFATEHGPSGGGQNCCRDELNLIEAGKNYGWPAITGDQTREGMVSPIIQSGASTTWAPGGAAFVTSGPWQGSLLFTGLLGQTLYRVTLDAGAPPKVLSFDKLFEREYGRLRDVAQGPDGAIYVLTSNSDGRGTPDRDGDKVLRLSWE